MAEKVGQKMPFELHNPTHVFGKNESKMVKNILNTENNNALALGLSLPGLNGKLGSKKLDNNGAQLPRLGRELASAAKLAGVKGIFHSDELPAYGISQSETYACKKILGDCFVLCLAPNWKA